MIKSVKYVLMLFVLINKAGLLAGDKTAFSGFCGRFSPEPAYPDRAASPAGNNALITAGYLRYLAEQAKVEQVGVKAGQGKVSKSAS